MNPVKRILVVDDESAILFLLEPLLAAEGYEVVTAPNFDEALRLSQTQWFDLFLIDLIMPGEDGIETILSLRTIRKNAPIIAMSGGWHGGTRSCLPLAGKLGACGTLAKPFDRDILLQTVRSILESVPRKPHHGFPRKSHGDTAKGRFQLDSGIPAAQMPGIACGSVASNDSTKKCRISDRSARLERYGCCR